VNSLLSLEQNEASIAEAESSREQAQVAIQQGKILMAFTVVTILFVSIIQNPLFRIASNPVTIPQLPLSFLVSLFALNITIFPHEGDEVGYDPKWIFPVICKSALRLKVVKHL
jgi:Mg2+ and Co2+ transporter CorA